MEIWVRPSGQVATPSSQRGGSESSRDSEQDGELGSLSASEVSPVTSSGCFILSQFCVVFLNSSCTICTII